MAWVLRTDAKKSSIGFVRASDLAPKHRFVLEEDDFQARPKSRWNRATIQRHDATL